jgi:hypothetical protein
MPWEKIWPQESVAYIRVTPGSWDELENDESVSEYTHIYGDRVVHIWESIVYDHDGQEEEDEITRAKIIWERLNPTADWFYCHTDGTRIDDGEAIPHHAHIIIGLRDEVDPEWWRKATNNSTNVAPTPNPKPVQPACLAPARLDQPGAAAQVRDGEDAHHDEDSEVSRGKSASCTATESLRLELETLKSMPTRSPSAIITFENHSVQTFLPPENVLEALHRKVKEFWKIARKMYYLLITGVHETVRWSIRNGENATQVRIKGLLGGAPIRYRYATRYEGKRTKGCGPVFQTTKEIAERLKIPTQGLRVNHGGHVFPISATLEEIFWEEDNGTFDFEKAIIYEIVIEHPSRTFSGFCKGEHTIAELASLEGWNIDEGTLVSAEGAEFKMSDLIIDVTNGESFAQLQWTCDEEDGYKDGPAGWNDVQNDPFSEHVKAILFCGLSQRNWTGRADTLISQIQQEIQYAIGKEKVWTEDDEEYPTDTPVGVFIGSAGFGLVRFNPPTKPKEGDPSRSNWEEDGWGTEDESPH